MRKPVTRRNSKPSKDVKRVCAVVPRELLSSIQEYATYNGYALEKLLRISMNQFCVVPFNEVVENGFERAATSVDPVRFTISINRSDAETFKKVAEARGMSQSTAFRLVIRRLLDGGAA